MLWSSLEAKKLQAKLSLLEYIASVFSSHVIVAFRIWTQYKNNGQKCNRCFQTTVKKKSIKTGTCILHVISFTV